MYDWTLGCVAVTNEEIEEVWKLVPVGTPVEVRP
jgi:lipoprotein-anchoring transpeptidase ErfK/SrfK